MIPLELEMEGFMSYQDRTVLPIADQGLVLIKAENRVSNALDSNGAGKTTIFHALSFGLYGVTLPMPKVPNGWRGDEVINRFRPKGPCSVTVRCRDGERRVDIVRRRLPASLSFRGDEIDDAAEWKDDPQAWIVTRLGYGYRTFRNALIFSQAAFDRFSLADQADQLRMLDEIQGLDFRAAMDTAKRWRDMIVADLERYDQAIAVLDQRVVSLLEQEAMLEETAKRWRIDKRKLVADARSAEALAYKAERRAKRDLEEAQATYKEYAAAAQKWDVIQRLRSQMDDLESKVKLCQQVADEAYRVLMRHDAAIKSLINAGQCPTCRQTVTEKAVSSWADDDLYDDRKAARCADRQLADRQHEYELACQVYRDAVKRGPVAEEVAKLQVVSSEETIAELCRTYDDAKAANALAGSHVVEMEARDFSDADLLASVRKTLRTVRSDLESTKAKRERAARLVAAAEYWVEAFGDRGIRSLLIDSVSGFLNDRIAVHNADLAASEAVTKASAQTVLKSGALKERFSISTSWAWGAAGLAGGSSGQDRRVDLSLFAALQDVAESRSARPFPFKVYDEPADSLDPKGRELFASWVHKQARRRGGSVFLITHNPALVELLNPDRVWTVIFDRTGSHVEIA